MTFLKDFISKKYLEYEEPSRKGAPKNKKNISRKKYLAALIVGLYELSLKEISETGVWINNDIKIEFTYPMLKKWKMDPAFNRIATEVIDEFATRFIEGVKIDVEKLVKEQETYLESKYLFGGVYQLNPEVAWQVLKLGEEQFNDPDNNPKHFFGLPLVKQFAMKVDQCLGTLPPGISKFNAIKNLLNVIERGQSNKKKTQVYCRMIYSILDELQQEMEGVIDSKK